MPAPATSGCSVATRLADKAIRTFTNSPVNHVAMVVALDDLPPLLWHTEMGQTLEDVWTATHHRGAQLNRLGEVYPGWTGEVRASRRTSASSAARSPGRWRTSCCASSRCYDAKPFPKTGRLARWWVEGRFRKEATGEAVYCAQLLAITFRRMGLLDPSAPSNWYDPGKFWSGDRLELADGATLGGELHVVDD